MMKKIIPILTAAACFMPYAASAADTAPEGAPAAAEKALVSISFDEPGTGTGSFTAEAGGTVTEHGNIAYADGVNGKALSITEKSAENYLELEDGILDGCTAATYTFRLKPTSADVPNWPFMTTPDETQTMNYEKYVGVLATTTYYTAERYNNSGTRLSSVTTEGDYSDWEYVAVVFDENGTRIYVNGMLAASDETAVDLSAVFTADSKTWLGHANWGEGEGFSGMIDDFAIYGTALSEDEIQALAGDSYTEALNEYLNENNRLVIKTNFYNGDDKVFQFGDGDPVTVKTTIENLMPSEANLTVSLTPYSSVGALDGAAEASYSIPVTETRDFEANVTVTPETERIAVTVTDGARVIDAGSIYRSDVIFPSEAPEDTYGTTMAAHDPSIFKDPETGIYYAYNTDAYSGEYESADGETLTDTYPMDTFVSEDLIHWERIDNNFRIPGSAVEFFDEIFTPMGSAMNTGIWAPDMFYAEEDTEHPYWLYYSLSTNGTSFDYTRSAIGLVKGESPTGPWTDCGIIISTDENDCNTNAIDSNIYEDTNGDRFFIWGSFQRGIHQVKLTEDGRAEGVDYTSNASIHSSSKDLGDRLFSVPSGHQGPEGPYMINNTDTGYRYMFVSYGWLGTNYNVRIARNSLENTWASETAEEPHRKLEDQKGRLVGTTFADQVKEGGSLDELWGYKLIGSYKLGDGITYYGNGHNSVLHDDDGNWYLADHSRKVPDGYAALQIRKMLWTDEGWPVVSPLTYSGETEQTIPIEMLYGTWDLSSVGQTIFADGVNDVSNRNSIKNVDLPVLSSEIIISPDGTLGGGLGTWEYDGDHTVTLHFTKDGDPENYEFYKNGDTMELYVLTGYDKDQRESALVMTGTDQDMITQFAKKNNAVAGTAEGTAAAVTITAAALTDTGISVTTTGFENMSMIAAGYSNGKVSAVSNAVTSAEAGAPAELTLSGEYDTVKVYISRGTTLEALTVLTK